MTPSLGSINFLEQLTELRETFYLLRSLVYYKRYNTGTARWKRCIEQVTGKGCRTSMPSPGAPLSPDLYMFINPEAPWILYFWDFMEASPCKHDQSLTPFSTLLPLKRMQCGAENSKLLIISWSFWCPDPIQEPPRSPPRVASLEQKTLLSPRKLHGVSGALCQYQRSKINIRTGDAPTVLIT